MKKEKFGNKHQPKIYVYNKFKGVDYAHAPANISPARCVNGLNMVRSEVGKVHKRTGFAYDDHVWAERVNGVHFLQLGEREICLVHSGTGFYADENLIYNTAADHISHSVQIGDKLYILDGETFMVFDGTNIKPADENPYIPTTWINRTPEGGGKSYEQANILTAKRREGFIADGTSKVYNLSQPKLDSTTITAVIYRDDGTFYTASHENGCTVDTLAGVVTFSSPPPASKIKGQDNVYITYSKSGDVDGTVLNGCTVMALFGAGGRPDTLFLSGHPDYPGREWFSQPDNPVFFGVNNTDLAGSDNSPVVGYSSHGDKLFVHRKDNERHLNVVVRSCSGGDSNNYAYPVINALQGPDATGYSTFVNMPDNPLFLTDNGVYGVTKSEITGGHYTQLRSFYINPSLLSGHNLSQAWATAFNDFYVLAVGQDIYLLDTLQKSHENDQEYSDYQYECYHWQLPEAVSVLFVQNRQLCFITHSGKTGRFFTDYNLPENFNDDGLPITALWQTGEFTADVPHRIKDIYRVWVVCATALRTGVKVQAQIRGIWTDLYEDNTTARYFRWSRIQWSKFTWATDKTPKLIKNTVRMRNINKTAIRLENNKLNEPFGIYELGFEYLTGGYFR